MHRKVGKWLRCMHACSTFIGTGCRKSYNIFCRVYVFVLPTVRKDEMQNIASFGRHFRQKVLRGAKGAISEQTVVTSSICKSWSCPKRMDNSLLLALVAGEGLDPEVRLQVPGQVRGLAESLRALNQVQSQNHYKKRSNSIDWFVHWYIKRFRSKLILTVPRINFLCYAVDVFV